MKKTKGGYTSTFATVRLFSGAEPEELLHQYSCGTLRSSNTFRASALLEMVKTHVVALWLLEEEPPTVQMGVTAVEALQAADVEAKRVLSFTSPGVAKNGTSTSGTAGSVLTMVAAETNNGNGKATTRTRTAKSRAAVKTTALFIVTEGGCGRGLCSGVRW